MCCMCVIIRCASSNGNPTPAIRRLKHATVNSLSTYIPYYIKPSALQRPLSVFSFKQFVYPEGPKPKRHQHSPWIFSPCPVPGEGFPFNSTPSRARKTSECPSPNRKPVPRIETRPGKNNNWAVDLWMFPLIRRVILFITH